MAEGNRRQDQIQGAAETMRRGARQAPIASAEIIGRAGKLAARQGDATLEATARRAGEVMERGMETAQRSGADVARRAEAIEANGRQFAQGASQVQAEPRPAAVGMVALPQVFAGILGDMARANWQIGQEMFRLANPLALIELQQRVLHGYLDLIMAGQAKLDRTAQAAEAAITTQAAQAAMTTPAAEATMRNRQGG